MKIHRTAIVDPQAQLAEDVEVAPYALIDGAVMLAAGCRVGPHAHLQGPLEIGEECTIGFSTAIGHDPQMKGASGPFGATRIGARNVFRELSQVHRSMDPEGATVIGDDCYFMATSHVAHDCEVGDHVTLSNGVLLSGHCIVGDRVFISSFVGVHQYSRVGELAMIGGMSAVSRDAAPFCTTLGSRPARPVGLNTVGLRRAGIAAETRNLLQAAYRTLFRSDLPLPERLEAVEITCPEVERLVKFLRESKRGVIGFGPSADRE